MINRKPDLRETVHSFLSDYLTQLVTLPGWPQYCVTRAVLHCLIHDSEFFGWLSSREKNWLIAYVRPASSDQVEVAYDEACELYEEAEALAAKLERNPASVRVDQAVKEHRNPLHNRGLDLVV